jgi:hypothetical protein
VCLQQGNQPNIFSPQLGEGIGIGHALPNLRRTFQKHTLYSINCALASHFLATTSTHFRPSITDEIPDSTQKIGTCSYPDHKHSRQDIP